MAGENVIELLVKAGILDDRQHAAVHSRANTSNGGQLVQQVADMGYATEATVARALSVELGLPRIDLHVTPPEPDATLLLELRFCTERFVLPVALREGGELLWLAMGDPTDSTTMALVRRQTGKRVRPVVAGPTEILREARRIYAAATEEREEQQFEQDSGAISINEAPSEERFEVVNIADESAAPPAEAPAVYSPQSDEQAEAPSSKPPSGNRSLPPTFKPSSQPSYPQPPQSDEQREYDSADAAAEEEPLDLNAWLTTPKTPPGPAHNDLHPEDVLSLEAVRASMEKAALVLRALAELCVEKGLFTREEMRSKNRSSIKE